LTTTLNIQRLPPAIYRTRLYSLLASRGHSRRILRPRDVIGDVAEVALETIDKNSLVDGSVDEVLWASVAVSVERAGIVAVDIQSIGLDSDVSAAAFYFAAEVERLHDRGLYTSAMYCYTRK
jgi:hypothetical protein